MLRNYVTLITQFELRQGNPSNFLLILFIKYPWNSLPVFEVDKTKNNYFPMIMPLMEPI